MTSHADLPTLLAYRQGELGALPTEVRDLVRIAVKKHISAEIEKNLSIPEALITPPDDAS